MPRYLKYDDRSKTYVPDKAPKDTGDSAPRPAALNVDTIDQDVHPTIATPGKPRRTRAKKAIVLQE